MPSLFTILTLAIPRPFPQFTLFPYTTLFRSMNPRMWSHPATRENVETLRARGVELVGPEQGDTAEGELGVGRRSEEHTSELQSHVNLVCRLLLEKKKKNMKPKKIPKLQHIHE